MTPGTAAAKKKNVTFGDHVVDNEEKRPLKSGIPDDCPGKFPSPGDRLSDDPENDEEYPEKARSRSKLTEAFEQARDESRKRKSKGEKRCMKDQEHEGDVEPEFAEPKSADGKFWKHEYDIYRTNTQREVKKLITKQKAAKSFARTKDIQCTELADQLKQEKKKADALEAMTKELNSQLKELQDKLRATQEVGRKHQDEIAMLKRQHGRKDSARPTSSSGAPSVPLESRDSEQQRLQRENANSEDEPVQRPSEPYKPSAQPEKPKTDLQTLRARLKSKTESLQTKPSDDIWAQSFGSSSLVITRTDDKQPVSPKAARATTSISDSNPLRTLDPNTLSNGRDTQRNSSMGSMEVECKSIPDLERNDSLSLPNAEDQPPSETCVQIKSLTSSSANPQTDTKPVLTQASERRKPTEAKLGADDFSMSVSESSPFQPHAKTMPTRSGLSPAGPREGPSLKTTLQNNTKENVSPTSKSIGPDMELKFKPSVMWSSINASQASKRSASMTGKDGKEVSVDRLEAARARINARGRVTS